MNDLISRQMAIDAAVEAADEWDGGYSRSREAVSSWLKQYGQDVLHGKYKFSLMYIWKNLMDLPSAQPERTCVNCDRTANNGGWYADGGTRCPIEEHYALPKDGYCHLWEKRNVTVDDYPERRTDD